MACIKDYIEQHPDVKFSGANPEDVKVESDNKPKDWIYNEDDYLQDEDGRLNYQTQRDEEVADSADHFFAPSEGY